MKQEQVKEKLWENKCVLEQQKSGAPHTRMHIQHTHTHKHTSHPLTHTHTKSQEARKT